MNYLDRFAIFDTIEEGEKNLQAALNLRDQMGGNLYWGLMQEDCIEISRKLNDMKAKEFFVERESNV